MLVIDPALCGSVGEVHIRFRSYIKIEHLKWITIYSKYWLKHKMLYDFRNITQTISGLLFMLLFVILGLILQYFVEVTAFTFKYRKSLKQYTDKMTNHSFKRDWQLCKGVVRTFIFAHLSYLREVAVSLILNGTMCPESALLDFIDHMFHVPSVKLSWPSGEKNIFKVLFHRFLCLNIYHLWWYKTNIVRCQFWL